MTVKLGWAAGTEVDRSGRWGWTGAQHNLSVNEPRQTHFSAEGVQAYSGQEVKALKERADRLPRQEGHFLTILQYQPLDLEPPQPIASQHTPSKQAPRKPRPSSRPNPRNASSLANQTVVKLEKQYAKKNALERKLDQLHLKYKQHFSTVDLKEGLQPTHFQQQIEEEGDQCLPAAKQPAKKKQMVKTMDDSFEEVELVGRIMEQILKPNRNYASKLGDALHFLFKGDKEEGNKKEEKKGQLSKETKNEQSSKGKKEYEEECAKKKKRGKWKEKKDSSK